MGGKGGGDRRRLEEGAKERTEKRKKEPHRIFVVF